MPCDICGATVQKVAGCAETQQTYWCPRCGSVLEVTGDFRRTDTPRITERVRRAPEGEGSSFAVRAATVEMFHFVWNGIAETAGVKRVE